MVSAGQMPFHGTTRTVRSARWTLLAIPSGRWIQIGYVLVDIALVSLNSMVAFSVRFLSLPSIDLTGAAAKTKVSALPLNQYLAFLLLYAGLVVLCCQGQDLYRTVRTRTALDESLAVFKAVGLATLLLTAFIYLSGAKTVSRLVVGSAGALNVTALVAWRLWKRRVVERRVTQGVGARNVLIVGAGRVGCALAHYLHQNKQLGYVVKGLLDHNSDPRMVGRIEDLVPVAQAQFVDEIFVTIPQERLLVKRVALEARRHHLNVNVVPELFDGLGWCAPIHYVGDFPIMELHREPIPVLGLFAKRVLDVVVPALGLLITSPVLLAIAIAVKFDSPGPIIYRSARVGKKGRKFSCYKFRTMVAEADALKEQLRHRNERNGPFFKISKDPRVTRVGGWLRKYSLDELPQLWNVLKGDMSLVGPRPHPLDDYERYDLDHLRRLDVKPGVTGLWQVTARQDPLFETNMKLDIEYIEKWNFWFDVKILLRTVPAILRGNGQ